MEHLAKRALKLRCVQIIRSTSVITLSRSCSYYHNKPSEGVSNNKSTVGEERRFEVNNNSNNNNIEAMSGVAGFVAETAAETFGDMAKESVDKAWDSAKNATRDVQDTVIASANENVVDTTEYRSFEDRKNKNNINNINKNKNNNNNLGLETKEDWEKYYN